MTDGTDVPEQDRWLLLQAYAAHNRRDLEALLALVSDDVDWPDDPRRLDGKAQVCAYWTEQWSRTRTHDQPVTLTRHKDGRVTVTVDQVVRAPDGTVISRGRFLHLHRLQSGRLAAMHLRPWSTCDAARRAAKIV